MNRQKGFIVWVYLAVFVLLAAAGTTVIVSYNNAIKGRETAENAAKTWQLAHEAVVVENTRLQGDIDAAKKTAVVRTAERDRANIDLAKTRATLDQLAAANSEAAANLALRINPDVRSLRRINAGCAADVKVQCTPRRSATDAGTPAGGRDGQGTDSRERDGAKSPS